MIKSAITVSIVEQARKGPFVFHDDVAHACRIASELGFDAVELFAPSADAIRRLPLDDLLQRYNLRLAAVGTGAGMVVQKLHLCDPDSARRQKAEQFIRDIMSAGADFAAPAIIGSMQGKWDDIVDQSTAQGYLREALQRLGEFAESLGLDELDRRPSRSQCERGSVGLRETRWPTGRNRRRDCSSHCCASA